MRDRRAEIDPHLPGPEAHLSPHSWPSFRPAVSRGGSCAFERLWGTGIGGSAVGAEGAEQRPWRQRRFLVTLGSVSIEQCSLLRMCLLEGCPCIFLAKEPLKEVEKGWEKKCWAAAECRSAPLGAALGRAHADATVLAQVTWAPVS